MEFKTGLSMSLFGGSGYGYGYGGYRKPPQTPVVINILPPPHCSCRACRGKKKKTTTNKKRTTTKEKQRRVYQYHGITNCGGRAGGGLPQYKLASYHQEVYAGNAAAASGHGATAAYRNHVHKHEVYESEEEEEEESDDGDSEESGSEESDSEDDDDSSDEEATAAHQPCTARGRPQEHMMHR